MNVEEHITRKTNLEANEGISGFKHYAAQQNHNAYRVFYNFIKEVAPAQILEIGTALGGFTDFLNEVRESLKLNTKILSYDIYDKPWYDEMREKGIDIRVESIFLNEKEDSFREETINFIKNSGTTIVLCDGGHKIREFNVCAEYLKPGDFMLAHDYAKDSKTFEEVINQKIWNWHEIEEKDIEESCIKYNLRDYNQIIFNNVAWVCKQKYE